MKRCNTCGEIKPLSEFYKKKNNVDGHENKCKKCRRIQMKNCHRKTCKQCGKEFTSGDKNAIYCSSKCHGESRKNQIKYNCDYCGKEASQKESAYNKKEHHFCSSECMHKFQKQQWTGSGSPLWNRIKYECDYCGKEIWLTPFEINQGQNNFCSKECCNKYRSENYRGENNPKYNPNITDEERIRERNYKEYYIFREKVYKRDNYTCQCCGDNSGNNLNAHHLDGYNWCKEKRVDVDNGITLCEKCHEAFHEKYGKGDNTKEQFEEFLNDYNKIILSQAHESQ